MDEFLPDCIPMRPSLTFSGYYPCFQRLMRLGVKLLPHEATMVASRKQG